MDFAVTVLSLAFILNVRFLQAHTRVDFNGSIEYSLAAWNCSIAPSRVRIKAARFAAIQLASARRCSEASSLLGEVIHLLPKLTPRYLMRGDQEHNLSTFTHLGADASSLAIHGGRTAAHSLRLLEHGRGIIMGLSIDCRSDSFDLRSKNPELFQRFERLRHEIDSPFLKIPGSVNAAFEEDKRRDSVQAIHEFDETLATIRQLPGFEGFQLPPASAALIAMACEGPIIMFNSTAYRSDAIIVTSSATKSLPLPKMGFAEVKTRMAHLVGLVRGRASTYPSRNAEIETLLLWL